MRPKGWDSKEMHLDMLRANVDCMDGQAFIEAGADAYEEGLKKSGTFGHLCDSSILTPGGEIVSLKGYNDMSLEDGTFVFIKEE